MFASIVAGFFVLLAVFALMARGYFKKDAKTAEKQVKDLDEEKASGNKSYDWSERYKNTQKHVKDSYNAATGALATAGVFLVIAGGIMLFACSEIVEAKQVGVVTTYGKVHKETMKSGWNWKSPLAKVTQIDATVQTDEYHGADCISVRIGDGNPACISVANRWSVNEDNAGIVFNNFRSDNPTESLRSAVVSTQLKAALATVLGKYDPTAGIKAEVETATFIPDYDQVAADVTALMEDRTQGLIDLAGEDAITISGINYDKATEARISDFQQEIAKTKTAKIALQTAKAQADANRELASSVSKDPNVLVAQCLQDLREGKVKNQPGYSCWPGGGSGVVIPSGR